MEMAYLGLFEKIFNWVLDRIFDPIFKWLTNLLTTIFTWIFNEILAPILLPILETVLEWAFELWKDIYAVHLYTLYSAVLKLIDYMESVFDIFIGIDEVTYHAGAGKVVRGSLLDVLLQQDTVSTIFWALTLGGLGIAMMLTIYGVAKSAFDLDFENKRPVSKVLTAMMKTFVQFFTVPFFVYFIVKLAAVILQGISYLLNQGNNTTLGRILFMIASLDAAKDTNYNVSTSKLKITLGTSPKDTVRYPFYSLDAANAKDYGDISAVMEKFDLSNFDYLVGAIAAIFLFFTLAVCLIKFVQRIFEVILLYIVSPYFVSTIPLDDGEKFGKWREMFVGKCFSGFGSAIGMRLYLMVCPMIMSDTIDFGASGEMDYIMKLFFLAGGAWAVFKSGPMLTNLLSFQAGQDESTTQAVAGGFLYAQTAGRMGKAVSSALQKKPEQGQNKQGANSKGGEQSDQKFKNSNEQLQSQPPKQGAWKTAKPSQEALKKRAEMRKNAPDGKPQVTIGAHRAAAQAAAPATTKAHHNIKLGSLFQSTYDEKGNHKFRIMGIGCTTDASGRTTSVKFPGMKLSKDENGTYKVSKFRLPGVANVKGKVENGTVKYSDVSILGMNYHRDKDGGKSFRIGSIGVDKKADGTYKRVQIGSLSRTTNDYGYHTYRVGSSLQVASSSTGREIRVGSSGKVSIRTDGPENKPREIRIGSLHYQRGGSISKAPKAGGDKA